MLNVTSTQPTLNGTSALEQARVAKHREDSRKDQAVLTQRIQDLEQRVANLRTELVQKAADDEVDARSKFWNALLVLLFALLLGTGFVFFAEYSLQLIGFQWAEWKMYFAGVVFWLGTIVTMHIYLSSLQRADFSELPWFVRVFPLFLIIVGVIVLALARGLGGFLGGADASGLTTLAKFGEWSGLIAQVTLSLGLDLGSGVVGWTGVNRLNAVRPIWRRWRKIERLNNWIEQLKEKLAAVQAELPSATASQPYKPGDVGPRVPSPSDGRGAIEEDEKPLEKARTAGNAPN